MKILVNGKEHTVSEVVSEHGYPQINYEIDGIHNAACVRMPAHAWNHVKNGGAVRVSGSIYQGVIRGE